MPLYAINDPRIQTIHLASQHSISSATGTEVTGLRAVLGVGTFRFEYFLICRSSATGTGLGFGFDFGAGGTASRFLANMTYPSTGTTAATGVAEDVVANLTGSIYEASAARTLSGSTPNLGPFTGVAASGVDILIQIFGIIEVSALGILQLFHASEGAVATTVEVGSNLVVIQVA